MPLIVCSPSTKNFMEGEHFVVTSPPKKDILKHVGKYKEVIAIGGGAVIDTAKILSSTPIICYPTTASGASATSHSVYWDGNFKLNFISHKPKHVYFNPEYIKTLPKNALLYTKYDAISHCLDVMWSKDYHKLNPNIVGSTLTQLLQSTIKPIDIIRLGHDAGTFIEKVPTTILHALSYPLTGIYGVPHGKALGFLIPPVCRLMGMGVDSIIEKLDSFVDFDVDVITHEAQQYSKFFNTKNKVNIDRLKKELINEKN